MLLVPLSWLLPCVLADLVFCVELAGLRPWKPQALPRGLPLRPATDYFVEAVQTVRANKEAYAEAESRARSRVTPAAAL